MDRWSKTPHPALCISMEDDRSPFLFQLFPDPVKAMSGQLAPFRGHGLVGIVCNELGLHRQLAGSDITKFGVICVLRGATKGHDLVSELHSSYSSI